MVKEGEVVDGKEVNYSDIRSNVHFYVDFNQISPPGEKRNFSTTKRMIRPFGQKKKRKNKER